ncbi:TetR/AcrR family transcriptional regulator [Sutterella sp.]|uniref:TetR/AcrR family transcriptional regulator n=1 Tax=Sutterella sp. TaxID=1981025 RepID=UPI0026DF6F49|nr:TetR/AcrR family transcriptional regulator [Sutterella sp.]MDO5532111.1 TetR/AcrR family transcriptional regulator [Sutterella sp.]
MQKVVEEKAPDKAPETVRSGNAVKARTRLAPDERRGQILDAAAACFMREGRRSMSMNDIAREVGVSRNLVYHYFHSQEALIEALVMRANARFRAEMEAVPDISPEETMHALALCYVRFNAENASGVRFTFSVLKYSAKIAPHVTEMHELVAERFARAMGLPFEGAVRTALLSAGEFMMQFVLGAGEQLLANADGAADLIVDVARTAAAGAARIEAAALSER